MKIAIAGTSYIDLSNVMFDMTVTNQMLNEQDDVAEKVYTRDLFRAD